MSFCIGLITRSFAKLPALGGQAGGRGDGRPRYWGANLLGHVLCEMKKMSKDTLKGLYGMNDDVILYWAHHEKLCLIDGRVAWTTSWKSRTRELL
jgi:hypothetical protein